MLVALGLKSSRRKSKCAGVFFTPRRPACGLGKYQAKGEPEVALTDENPPEPISPEAQSFSR